jgi:DNA-directed RNA polymerase sigma subunit (sigma70/sigma32)
MRSESGRPQRETEIDAARQAELWRSAAAGDKNARQEIFDAHLRLVDKAVQERRDRSLGEVELFQEGAIGLLAAIDSFAARPRTDFAGYARALILSQIDAALSEEDEARDQAQQLLTAVQAYEQAEIKVHRDLGRQGTVEELAASLHWTVERVVAIGDMVERARHRHDEEMLPYLDSEDIDLDQLHALLEDGKGSN